MEQSLADAIEIYNFSDELRPKALAGLTREELLHRAGELSNPIIWMAGHIAVTRFRIGNVLGPEETVPMEDLFGGPSKAVHTEHYPGIEEINKLHQAATERMYQRLKSVSPAKLAEKTPRAHYTVGVAVTRAAYHEGLHMGQIFFIRKLLGHAPSDPIMD